MEDGLLYDSGWAEGLGLFAMRYMPVGCLKRFEGEYPESLAEKNLSTSSVRDRSGSEALYSSTFCRPGQSWSQLHCWRVRIRIQLLVSSQPSYYKIKKANPAISQIGSIISHIREHKNPI